MKEINITDEVKNVSGTEVSIGLFGGVLDEDGAGFYSGLELLNFVFLEHRNKILPSTDTIKLTKRGHDFSRRFVWDEEFSSNEGINDVLYNSNTQNAIRHLLEGLQLPLLNRRKAPSSWSQAFFFPYTKSLIHWDARTRATAERINIERRYLRGGGALVYKILRKDKNISRLERVRQGFISLYKTNQESALETIMSTMLAHGNVIEDNLDDIEKKSLIRNDKHEDVYCEGVLNILEHNEMSVVARIKALTNWTGYWLVLMQVCRSLEHLELSNRPVFICDCGASQSQLRRSSQKSYKDSVGLIVSAIDDFSGNHALSKRQKAKIKGFFTKTSAVVKLTNSWTGRRHFTIGLELMETLVMASCKGAEEIPYDRFVNEYLFEKFGLIVGRRAAEMSGQLTNFDASVFEDNQANFANQMKAAGLLKEYSDATQMVGMGGLL